jgi:hypothetical protein
LFEILTRGEKMSLVVFLNVNEIKETSLSFASIIVALCKTPNVSRVNVWGNLAPDLNKYLDRIPRSVNVQVSESSTPFAKVLQDELLKISPQSMVVVVQDFSYLFLPECFASAATGVVSGFHYCQFEEILNDAPGVVNFAMKYWKAPSYSETLNYTCQASTLVQDLSVFQTYEKPFEILDILKNRKISTPFPSLAAKLPLQNTQSLIPWHQVKQMIEQF